MEGEGGREGGRGGRGGREGGREGDVVCGKKVTEVRVVGPGWCILYASKRMQQTVRRGTD